MPDQKPILRVFQDENFTPS